MTDFGATVAYDADAEVVRIDVTGRPAASDLLELYGRVIGDHGGRSRLWDYRAADLTGLSGRDLAVIADAVSRKEPEPEGFRVAVVVEKDVDFGISRMYQALAERRLSVPYEVFRNLADAERWLRDGPEASAPGGGPRR